MVDAPTRIIFHPRCESCAQPVQLTLADWHAETPASGIGWSCPHCARTNRLPVFGRLLNVAKKIES